MQQKKHQIMIRYEDEVAENYASKIMAGQLKKPHRKLLSGLKLFRSVNADSFNALKKSKNEDIDFYIDQDVTNQVDLPHHLITHDIFTKLSVKTLLQIKSVSKEWYSTISSSEFAKLHLEFCLSKSRPWSPIECLFIQAENNFYILYYQEKDQLLLNYYFVKVETDFNDENELDMVGSCNGLVCLANSSPTYGYFYIWNPITQSCQKFSDPYTFNYRYKTSWGFAYVSSVDDYKVVRLVQNCNTLDIVVHIFSLKNGKWKPVYDHGLDYEVSITKTDPGVLVNSTLYWIVNTSSLDRSVSVVGFDLSLEKFSKSDDLVPPSITPWHHFLCVMGGCLSMCGLNMNNEVYISILKEKNGVESICLNSDLVLRLCSVVVGFTRMGRFFVVSKNWELALVDPNSSPKQYDPLITFKKGRKPCIISYIPSLVSPCAISGSQFSLC